MKPEGMSLEWHIEKAQWLGASGGKAFASHWWVPDEMHPNVSLKCAASQPRGVTCPSPCSGRSFPTLFLGFFVPWLLCTSSDGASTSSLGKPCGAQREPAPKQVVLIFSPSFPFCNYIPALSALPLCVTLNNSFPSSVCLHPCSGSVFDPPVFLSRSSLADSWLVLQEPL